MRFGSVCSGIEAASVAWHPLGWQAAWFSEIEPFPCAVLNHHYPDVPNLGDMTTLPDRIRKGEVEAPDLFCGGTPCQAFSVAGLRKSLDDARGNLSLTFCEIANAIDSVRSIRGEQPCVVFWENVPGVLNTKDNAFGCFLGALAGADSSIVPNGRWTDAGVVAGPQRTVAWRTLDAQYFGVAQRRRRVFVVASARTGFDPSEILFEWTGLRRDTAPSREAGKETTVFTPSSIGGYREGLGTLRAAGGDLGDGSEHLLARPYASSNDMTENGTYIPMAAAAYSIREDAIANTFSATPLEVSTAVTALRPSPQSHHAQVFVAQPVPFGVGEQSDTAHCLRSGASKADKHESTTYVATPIAFPANLSGTQHASSENIAPTMGAKNPTAVATPIAWDNELNASADVAGTIVKGGAGGRHDGVAQPIPMLNMQGSKGNAVAQSDGPSFTLNAMHGHDVHAILAPTLTASNDPSRSPQSSEVTKQVEAVHSATMAVRRLTPVECERLQGFPDHYTQIPWRGKPVDNCPDGPRYKALGNSWAVPVVRWIGARIQACL